MARPFQVRSSPIHGKGVFATRRIRRGTRLIEYTGERISWDEADRRYDDDIQPHHTFLFAVDEDVVIDGGVRGSAARWINHSCEPNCEAVDEDSRIFIEALRDIAPGEELTYDYSYILDEPHTAKVKARYPCRCGSRKCRGTILGDKRRFRELLAREERAARAERRARKESGAKKKRGSTGRGAKKRGSTKAGAKKRGAAKRGGTKARGRGPAKRGSSPAKRRSGAAKRGRGPAKRSRARR